MGERHYLVIIGSCRQSIVEVLQVASIPCTNIYLFPLLLQNEGMHQQLLVLRTILVVLHETVLHE